MQNDTHNRFYLNVFLLLRSDFPKFCPDFMKFLNRFRPCIPTSITLVCFGGWFPVVCTDDRQANLTLFINVWMVNFGFECHFGRFEGILSRKGNFNLERAFIVGRKILRMQIGRKYNGMHTFDRHLN